MDIKQLKEQILELPNEQRMKLLCEIGRETCGDLMGKMMNSMDYDMMSQKSGSDVRTAGEPLTFNVTDDVNIVFSWIPAGEFLMGSDENEQGHEAEESPQHPVSFAKGFYMSRFTITQGQWNTVMEQSDLPTDQIDPEKPVIMVSWQEAMEFAEKLSKRFAEWKFSLPTEAQWEYTCRAGSDSRFAGGDSEDKLAEMAWYAGNSDGKLHGVGKRAPNKWNLFDMHGNVFEWCRDWEGAYPETKQKDPLGPDAGSKRVLRGGCFKCPPPYCRSANRYSGLVDNRSGNIGFRIIAELI